MLPTLGSISSTLRIQWCVLHNLLSLPSLRQADSLQSRDLYIVSLADLSAPFISHPIQSDLLGKSGPLTPCLCDFFYFF